MGQTFAEKILAKKSGRDQVRPGEFVIAKIDGSLANDVTAPLLIRRFKEMELKEPFRLPGDFAIYCDHFVPAPTERSAQEQGNLSRWCKEFDVYYSGPGAGGHLRLPIERGHCRPGMLFVGADSHTVLLGAVGAFAAGIGSSEQTYVLYKGDLWFKVPESMSIRIEGDLPPYCMGKDIILMILGQLGETGALYRAVEFFGPVVDQMGIDGRISLCGLTLEMGGKIGVVPADEKVIRYVKSRTDKPFDPIQPDHDAVYVEHHTFDVSGMEAQVAVPPQMDQAKPVSAVAGTKIHQVYIGSCVNGGLEDMAMAARILKGKKAHPDVRLIIVPQSRGIYADALKAGYVETFVEAGAMINPPGCGPCVGSHSGVMPPGERVVSTGCRNFSGRMGSPKAEIYVASPSTAAASAIAGVIADPAPYF